MKRNLLLLMLLSISLPLLAQYEQRYPAGQAAPQRDHLLAPAPGARAKSSQNNEKHKSLQNNETYYYEGFEDWNPNNSSALPSGWQQYRTQTLSGDPFASELADTVSLKWYLNNPDFYPYSDGSYTDYVYAGEGSMGVFWDAPGYTWAVTPTFTLGTSEKDIILSFYPWLANNFTNNWITKFHVRVYADGTWFQLYSYNAQEEDSNIFDRSVNLPLNAFEGKDIRIGFIHEYNDGIQMAIDEITVAEEMDNDFGLSDLEVFPSFGLLPGTEVGVYADASSFGNIDGAVEVTLLVNGVPVDKLTTDLLAQGGESESVFLSWTPDEYGDYLIQLKVPNDDFAANNLLEDSVYVNHYQNLAEGFENFTTDAQGDVTVVWPPTGWTVNDPEWLGPTTQWPIFDYVSAMLIGRDGASEKALITPPISLSDQDEFISFYLEGVNNNVFVEQTGATPQGEQGFSTFQLKYSTSVDGPWTNLGEPVVFENLYDANDNLIQGANDRRYISHDITGLANGTYYFAFTATSTFNLTIGGEDYYSFVMVDNILISQDPTNADLPLYYRITIPIEENPVQYKYFVIEQSATWDMAEWEGEPNREITVTADIIVEDIWGVKPDASKSTQNAQQELNYVTFKVDMKDAMIGDQAFNPDIHRVFIAGSFGPDYGWKMPGSVPELEMTTTGGFVPVGINQLQPATTSRIYPNPASDYITIESDVNIDRIEIYSILGNKVLIQAINKTHLQLNIAKLSKGMYVAVLYTVKGNKIHKLQITR